MQCRRIIYGLPVALAVLFAAACTKEAPAGSGSIRFQRTLLVWLGGDNNLSRETAAKIAAINSGWIPERTACLIYEDTRDKGARLLRLYGTRSGTASAELLCEYGRENSASAKIFGRVLDKVMTDYPAESYGLLFFSHGSGWLPEGMLQTPVPGTSLSKSLGWDEGVQSGGLDHAEMELTAFAAAIPDGALDFVVFETCLTAGIEVAYELRNKTRYMLASPAEILSPGFTPVYGSSFRLLLDTSESLEKNLTAFGESYMRHVNTLGGDYRSATLSLIATDVLDILAGRIRDMSPRFETPAGVAGWQRFDRPGSYGDTPALPRYFDLGQWMEGFSDPAQYPVLEQLLKRIVKWKGNTKRFLPSRNGFEINRYSGLTVYLPRPEFGALNEAYRLTSWYKAVYVNKHINVITSGRV